MTVAADGEPVPPSPTVADDPVAGEGATDHETGVGPAFWIGAVVGWTLIAYGLYGKYHNRIDTRPTVKARELGRFFAGLLIGHDVLVVPLVLLVGVAVARLVPGRVRAFVQGAMIVTATLALFAYPSVRGFGRHVDPANHTLVPRNYARGLVVSVALVWAAALALAAAQLVRSRHRRSLPTPEH